MVAAGELPARHATARPSGPIRPRNLDAMSFPSITRTHLDRAFGVATVARGRAYHRQAMVVDWKWYPGARRLTGTCMGSGGLDYEQDILLAGSSDTITRALCTCPVGAYCKHSVAVLLTAELGSGRQVPVTVADAVSGNPAAQVASWRTAIAGIVGTGKTVAPQRKKLALAFSTTMPNRFSPTSHLQIRPMVEGAKQPWIKTGATWNEISYGFGLNVVQEHLDALQAIYRALTTRGYASNNEWQSLGSASASIWQLISNAKNVGVELIQGPSMPGPRFTSVVVGQAELAIDITEHPDGARLTRQLIVDGEPVDPKSVQFVGNTVPHGLWCIDDGCLTVAGFTTPPAVGEVEALTHGHEIVIPAADLTEFSLEVLPKLTQVRATRVAEGVFTPPTIEGPEAVLTISDNVSGPRYSWSVGYGLNDKTVVFDPTQAIGDTSYRDAGVEDALWERLRPAMERVAAQSSSWGSQVSGRILAFGYTKARLDEAAALEMADSARQAAAQASLSTLRLSVALSPVEVAVLSADVLPELADVPGLRVDYQLTQTYTRNQNAPRIAFAADEEGSDWFGLDVAILLGNQRVRTADVIVELNSGAQHMLLPDNTFFSLEVPELQKLSELLEEARSLGEIESGKFSSRSLNATFWEELLELGVVDAQLAQWRKRMAQLASAKPPRTVKPSKRLQAELREYQQAGFDWLMFLWKNELGGVLADDMGLGKTVQTLALVAKAVDAKRDSRFLVIAPTSVVPNWVAECQKFVPGVRVSSITATPSRTGSTVGEMVGDANIVVTSYALLRILFDDLDDYTWDGVIFDEAQFIKNHTGKTHQCARRLDAPFKLAITGTPMENNLMELWSLLSVTAPGLFPSPTAFTEYFRKPIESGTEPERLGTLRRRIKPVMLRRTKTQVAIDLPAKQEQAMVLELGTKHRKVYDTRLARERQKVLGLLGDWEKNRFQIFRSLSMLRQLSLHAALVDSSHHEVASAKVEFLAEQLPALIDEGHSALVFSQFTGFLSIVRSQLDELGIEYSYLDGSMTAAQRDSAVRRFTSGVTQVFLISLKAGGFGLNLTEADYCFVCDPWWNPAAEAQAIDRAHRIGQQRPVTVYRLVSADTIEERVVKLQDRKRALFDAVVDDGDLFGTALSATDIREMLG